MRIGPRGLALPGGASAGAWRGEVRQRTRALVRPGPGGGLSRGFLRVRSLNTAPQQAARLRENPAASAVLRAGGNPGSVFTAFPDGVLELLLNPLVFLLFSPYEGIEVLIRDLIDKHMKPHS